MEEVKDKIIIYLEKKNEKLSNLIELFSSNEIERDLIQNIIRQLEIEGRIYIDNFNQCIIFPTNSDLIQGKLKKSIKGEYYVYYDNEMITIPEECLNGALLKDIVVVQKSNYDKSVGKVKKIVKRYNSLLIVDYDIIGDKPGFTTVNNVFNYDIILSDKDYKQLDIGDRFILKIIDKPKPGKFDFELIKKVGHKDDPNLEIRTILLSKEIPIEFDEETIKELDEIPDYVSEKEIENRLDLRDKNIFTIDGISTKDFDDAVSIEKKENGNYILGVHIADVANYVRPNSAIFKEALNRGTSIYITDYVIPMLPRKLSNGICSLNPNVDRLTISCIMEIDPTGEVINYKIVDSVINSKMRMTYEDVNEILNNNKDLENYASFKNDLLIMNELSNILNKKNTDRGYLNFGSSDIKIKVDENGKPIQIKKNIQGASEKLIENFMILANETVSKDISWKQLPCVYRVHDIPHLNALTKSLNTINELGCKIKIPANFSSYSIQNILNKLSKSELNDILSSILLTGMSRACYSPNNIGHFGLALDYYSHFTSPIRRFPDLMLHTLIKEYKNIYEKEDFNDIIKNITKKLPDICQDNSQKERRAEEIEREINKYKMVEFMENHIGETFSAIITYVSPKGLTIRTQNYITGSICINELKQLGYKYDASTNSLISKDRSYKIGALIDVKVKNASKNNLSIIFTLVKTKNKTLKKNKN